MLLAQPGLAVQRGQPAALNASCARRALMPIAQVVQKSNPGLESHANLANVGLTKVARTSGETRMDIAAWLQGLGLSQYERAFRENDVDTAVAYHR